VGRTATPIVHSVEVDQPPTRSCATWLRARLRAAGATREDLSAPLTIDLHSLIVPVYGRAKQVAAFGYTRDRSSPDQDASNPAHRL